MEQNEQTKNIFTKKENQNINKEQDFYDDKESINCIPCFGKAVSNARDIYTEYLTNILTPLIHEGLKDLYDKALIYEKQYQEKAKKNPDIKNPGVFLIFQHLMKLFKDMNNINVDDETRRIRNSSGCADFFDDLIRAVVKSHVAVLTCSNLESRLVNEKFHEKININEFIHKCYTESIKLLYLNPELFVYSNNIGEIKKNQVIIHNYIGRGITNAIKQILPMKEILGEFLSGNINEIFMAQTLKIKNMVQEDLCKNLRKKWQEQNDILEDSNEVQNEKRFERYDYDLEDFILGRKKDDTMNIIDTEKSEFPQNIHETKHSDLKPEEIQESKSEIKLEIPPLPVPQIDLHEFFSNNGPRAVYRHNNNVANNNTTIVNNAVGNNNTVANKTIATNTIATNTMATNTVTNNNVMTNNNGVSNDNANNTQINKTTNAIANNTTNNMISAIDEMNKKLTSSAEQNNGLAGINIVRKIKDSENHFSEAVSHK